MCHVNEQTFSALCCLPKASHCRVFTKSSICKTDSLAMLTRSHPSYPHTGFLLSTLLPHCCLLVYVRAGLCCLDAHCIFIVTIGYDKAHYVVFFFKCLLLLNVFTSDVQSVLSSITAAAIGLTQ